jgi:methionyl-tRNA formyltransferase
MEIWSNLIMKNKSETIVFFGSGPVASASLRLLNKDFLIEAVITKPRPAHHTGSVPVLDAAKDLNLTVYTAQDKASLDELFRIASFHAKAGVLVDFGIIVSQGVIDYFPLGIINSHFSLLPQWRGADPITFAILSGQKQTGVSLMLLVAAMDEGPLLAQESYPLSKTMTTPALTESLVDLSYRMLAKAIPDYITGIIKPYPQSNEGISYSRRLTKEDGEIDWARPAVEIERQIRAFLAWPQSRTTLAGKDIIITGAHVVNDAGPSGTTAVKNKQLVVFCSERALQIDRLKPAGKQEMDSEAFLAGYHLL